MQVCPIRTSWDLALLCGHVYLQYKRPLPSDESRKFLWPLDAHGISCTAVRIPVPKNIFWKIHRFYYLVCVCGGGSGQRERARLITPRWSGGVRVSLLLMTSEIFAHAGENSLHLQCGPASRTALVVSSSLAWATFRFLPRYILPQMSSFLCDTVFTHKRAYLCVRKACVPRHYLNIPLFSL